MAGVDFRLYLITDRQQAAASGRGGLHDVIKKALDAGVRAVQLREKDLCGRDLLVLAEELRVLTSGYGARLFINERLDVALAVDADGVHLPSGGFKPGEARPHLTGGMLIGASAHGVEEAATAERGGADFITLGPVFDTPSKAGYGRPIGVEPLKEAAGLLRIPIFAIGGMNGKNAPAALSLTGAWGIAVISAIVSSPEPGKSARELLTCLA